ncbi:hypothetical protein [Streptomyces aureoverticillatus]|uniref:hypothetical protein n=1 Tax=Streptomyces aureoverticillatus TaxID=66871 RepID=UPI0013D8EA04|nr:hypothetical protein [Streptomyces aureoverticillatus]QIB49558.1 hypothetical protein G3H79_41060 [Streptomyces aureoverticillatus]
MEPSETFAAFEAIVQAERRRERLEHPRSEPAQPLVRRDASARRPLQTYISGAMLGVMSGLGAGALLGTTLIIRALPAVMGGLLGVLAARRYMRWPEA